MFFVFLLSFLLFSSVSCNGSGHYTTDQKMDIWANKIGPYSSPTESYGFFDKVPWCRPVELERRSLKLGEALAGDHLVKSLYNLSFRQPLSDQQICEKSLNVDEVAQFIKAIRKRFVYDLLLDNLPMKLFVGELGDDDETSKTYLYTRIEFTISVNGGHVIEASATPGQPVELKEGERAKVRFSYSVKWEETVVLFWSLPLYAMNVRTLQTDFPFNRRAEKYKDPFHSRDLDIHWFSIGNAILSVLLLMGLLGSILMRVVREDFRDYEALDADDESDDFGWKLLYGDVFRFPRGICLLCPFLGAGVQLLTLSAILLLFGALEFFHPLSRGTIYTTAVLSYAATAGIAGFVSGYLYKQMGGSAWMRNAFVTVFVFCGPAALIWMCLNSVALLYSSTRALPLWTIGCMLSLWAIVTFPLTVFGAIAGKNQSRPYDAPGRTAKIPREIPKSAWYRRPPFLATICGLMPFSSIYVEMYFLFGAVWGHKIFQVYEMLGIAFVILMLVTTITTASAVYFQLVVENYKWAWASLGYGGSIGAYIFAYSVYYYYMRSPLEGFMQASFFFGYMVLVSYAFFLMCGTVGFFSARRFVRFLYSSVKSD